MTSSRSSVDGWPTLRHHHQIVKYQQQERCQTTSNNRRRRLSNNNNSTGSATGISYQRQPAPLTTAVTSSTVVGQPLTSRSRSVPGRMDSNTYDVISTSARTTSSGTDERIRYVL